MNNTKKVGRPKKFNESQALQAATEVFWSKGYDGASLKDLTEAMGINGPSLYATYGDKESLFLQSVTHYMANSNCTPLEAFEQQTQIAVAVRSFFEAIIQYTTEHAGGTRGCFLSSCVSTCAETIAGVKPLLQHAIQESENRLVTRFEQAKQAGELPQDFPSAQRARLMFDLRQGPVFRARAGLSAPVIRADIDYWVHMVLSSSQ
ncbi:MAG: TetR/AcrR family transcriptional regulator [Zetaproteobacteria bacterium]|nr:TetR/AcrR family transcriptional regulator [Zetaproteobacteria bacterium]